MIRRSSDGALPLCAREVQVAWGPTNLALWGSCACRVPLDSNACATVANASESQRRTRWPITTDREMVCFDGRTKRGSLRVSCVRCCVTRPKWSTSRSDVARWPDGRCSHTVIRSRWIASDCQRDLVSDDVAEARTPMLKVRSIAALASMSRVRLLVLHLFVLAYTITPLPGRAQTVVFSESFEIPQVASVGGTGFDTYGAGSCSRKRCGPSARRAGDPHDRLRPASSVHWELHRELRHESSRIRIPEFRPRWHRDRFDSGGRPRWRAGGSVYRGGSSVGDTRCGALRRRKCRDRPWPAATHCVGEPSIQPSSGRVRRHALAASSMAAGKSDRQKRIAKSAPAACEAFASKPDI